MKNEGEEGRKVERRIRLCFGGGALLEGPSGGMPEKERNERGIDT